MYFPARFNSTIPPPWGVTVLPHKANRGTQSPQFWGQLTDTNGNWWWVLGVNSEIAEKQTFLWIQPFWSQGINLCQRGMQTAWGPFQPSQHDLEDLMSHLSWVLLKGRTTPRQKTSKCCSGQPCFLLPRQPQNTSTCFGLQVSSCYVSVFILGSSSRTLLTWCHILTQFLFSNSTALSQGYSEMDSLSKESVHNSTLEKALTRTLSLKHKNRRTTQTSRHTASRSHRLFLRKTIQKKTIKF